MPLPSNPPSVQPVPALRLSPLSPRMVKVSLSEAAGALAASGHLPEESAATAALFDSAGNGAELPPADCVPALIDSAQRLLAVVETSINAGRADSV